MTCAVLDVWKQYHRTSGTIMLQDKPRSLTEHYSTARTIEDHVPKSPHHSIKHISTKCAMYFYHAMAKGETKASTLRLFRNEGVLWLINKGSHFRHLIRLI